MTPSDLRKLGDSCALVSETPDMRQAIRRGLSEAADEIERLQAENDKLRRVVEAAREMRDQYLPAHGIELQTFEDLWLKLHVALAALEQP